MSAQGAPTTTQVSVAERPHATRGIAHKRSVRRSAGLVLASSRPASALAPAPNEAQEPKRPLSSSTWYVVQVETGREERMVKFINQVATTGAIEECFVPRFATQLKVRGQWIDVEKPVFKGYVIVVTKSPLALAKALRSLEEYTHILGLGGNYVPLTKDEQAWLTAFTSRERRCVPMSWGFTQGGKVTVVDGPLAGREAQIKSFDRHHSTAFISLKLFDRTVEIRVGLGVLSSPEALEARAVRARIKAQRSA